MGGRMADGGYLTKETIFAGKWGVILLRNTWRRWKTRLVKWMVGLMIASAGIAATAAVVMQRLVE